MVSHSIGGSAARGTHHVGAGRRAVDSDRARTTGSLDGRIATALPIHAHGIADENEDQRSCRCAIKHWLRYRRFAPSWLCCCFAPWLYEIVPKEWRPAP